MGNGESDCKWGCRTPELLQVSGWFSSPCKGSLGTGICLSTSPFVTSSMRGPAGRGEELSDVHKKYRDGYYLRITLYFSIYQSSSVRQ